MKFSKSRHGLILALALLACAAPVPAFAASAAQGLEGFDITREPSKADWRYFIHAPPTQREQLWAYHSRRGKRLGSWAWGWRLGWVRVCGASDRPLCTQVLSEALFDKALVVRAEAASTIGRLYENTGDPRVVGMLSRAFGNGRNLRHGKPLFVQSRILYALHQIGGDAGRAAGQRLAAATRDLTTYWSRLDAAE